MPLPVKNPLVYDKLTYKLIGFGYAIHKELGSVHKEIVYQRAFEEELKTGNISFVRESHLPVLYKGKKIGVYVPDFVIDDKVIVELKAMIDIPQSAGTQLNYYLKATGFRVGLLLNFGSRRLQVRRRIYG